MMLNIGPKKKDNLSKMDKGQEEFLPQLSNEMQLSIMNKVKRGEMTIEDALNQAKKDRQQLLKQKTVDEVQPSQYNFSVYKHGRYRWQKRVLQIDFNTKMLCSIEKGIVKRQLPFAHVKSCDDGVGSRFSVSFKEHHDYELEATSVDDKHKIMELVNQIIYGNIYSQPTEGNVNADQQPPETKSLRYGVLFLHKGGLASFKWVKYEVHLHPAQLTLVRADCEVKSTVTPSIVIHLSDGDTSVEKPHSPDSFTLITHKNEYHFRVPVTAQTKSSEVLQQERDAWFQAIDKLCLEWKRKSQSEHIYDEPKALGLRGHGTTEDTEHTLSPAGTHIYSNLVFSGERASPGSDIKPSLPPADDSVRAGQTSGNRLSAAWDTGMSINPPAAYGMPVAKPRTILKTANHVPRPDAVPTSHVSTSVPASSVPTSPAPTSPVPASPMPTSPVPTSPVPTSPVPTSFMPSSTLPSSPVPISPQPTSTGPIAASSDLAPSTPPSSPCPSAPSPACTTPPSISCLPSSSADCSTSSSNVPPSPIYTTVPSARVGPPASKIPPPPPLFKPTKVIPQAARTKAFHWDLIVTDKIEKSFWTRARMIEIDSSRLFEEFAAQDLGAVSLVEPSNSIDILLNQKIAHNFNIFLKSFPVQPGELKDKLFIVKEEDGGLSDEQITSLRRYVPTPDDVEMYKSHQGPVTELHIVDQYMMEMCNIPYLSTRLDLLLTLRELPISMNDLQPLINQKITMCTQLYNSRSFVSVLEYLLAVGNYLNKNAGKEKAKGFRLSSLTKLSQLRGKNRKFTLLHALVEQIMLHEPTVGTNLVQELTEFETVPGASIKGLTAEVDVLKNELQKVIQYRKTYKKRNSRDQHQNFSNDLKMAVEKYNAELSVLTKKCEEMKKLYSDILVKFGEPNDRDSQELFGLVCQFIHDFRRTRAEII